MDEEECPVLPDRPSDPPTIAVIPPFGVFSKWRSLPCNQVLVGSVVAKPVVRVQLIILVIPIAGAVPIVAAPARDHLDLGTKRPGEVHTGVVRLHPELFQAFHGSGYYRSGSGDEPGVIAAAALHVAGGVATIEHEGVLVHPRPGYLSAVRGALARSAGSGETWNRHRLEKNQGGGIPAHRRPVRNEVGVHHRP